MDQSQDFKSLQEQIQSALIATTRSAGLISSEDLGFQRSLNPEVGAALDEQNNRFLALSTSLLKSAASISELRAPALEDADDVENNWRSVVDVIDSLLEKTDTCLDEYTGMIKRKEQPNSDQTPSKGRKQVSALGNAFRTQNLVKPQLAFEIKPDNRDTSPWTPLLEDKPHAILPLEQSLGTITNEFEQISYDYTVHLPLLSIPPISASSEGLNKSQRWKFKRRMKKLRDAGKMVAEYNSPNTDSDFRYKHPYETEIIKLKYPDAVFQQAEPIPYQPVDTTTATFVDTEEGVLEMLNELKKASEIAIDLEHHDARTYVGLTSLMQVSTREKDWIVDTLKPWRHKLRVLNEVFADPNIIKVFHGAFMDIIWLQRDLGLYVVGLFDTHHAARTLGYQGGSLAFLLKKFIDFDADKKYQMADWRIRPIPDEMFFYARADTHYLLYIYDNMRNELIEKSNAAVPEENKIEITLQKSKEVSLQRFERQIYNAESGRGPGGWYSLLVKTPALFNNEQFAVFRAVHEWRDQVARTDDDSTNFVMPNHVIFNIAKLLPGDMVALLSIAHPVSYSVKSRTGGLLEVIKKAKSQGQDGPSMMAVLRPNSPGAIAKPNAPAMASKLKSTPETILAIVDGSELRTDNSTFWGGAFGSSIWDDSTVVDKMQDVQLTVPLPQLSSEVFETSNTSTFPTPAKQPAKQLNTIEDQPFVLKRGSKRTSEPDSEPEEGEASGEYDISLNDLEDAEIGEDGLTKQQRKSQRKAEKRAKKKAKAEAQATSSAEAEDDDDEEPFDYSKAESVLNAKRPSDQGAGKKGKKEKQKPFDPYAKSADAPKGMRRAQTERAGKSHTFRS